MEKKAISKTNKSTALKKNLAINSKVKNPPGIFLKLICNVIVFKYYKKFVNHQVLVKHYHQIVIFQLIVKKKSVMMSWKN